MRVMVTGAFGNIGTSAVESLLNAGHTVRCFDLRTRRSDRLAGKLPDDVEVMWGDLRRLEEVTAAVEGQDVVVHLAFIIPKMSATGVDSEDRPDWARKVNVGGTMNLLEAMRHEQTRPKLIFTSSYHVYGRTQGQAPPRRVSDPLRPIEHYSVHKMACEEMVRASDLEWTIFRLAATLPIAIQLDPGMFDVPLGNRMEYVHTRDVGQAISNAVSNPVVWGKTLNIGGGPTCQYEYREIVGRILDGIGVGMLPEEAFGSVPFPTDWIDTTESQSLLGYQRRDLGHYVDDMRVRVGVRRHLIRLFRPIVRSWLLRKSPYAGRPSQRAPKRRLAPETS